MLILVNLFLNFTGWRPPKKNKNSSRKLILPLFSLLEGVLGEILVFDWLKDLFLMCLLGFNFEIALIRVYFWRDEIFRSYQTTLRFSRVGFELYFRSCGFWIFRWRAYWFILTNFGLFLTKRNIIDYLILYLTAFDSWLYLY